MPEPLPSSPSSALIDGVRFLGRRPAWTLGLILLGTLLGQLGPALEIAAKAGSDPLMGLALAWAALLPMELYLVPRWIARLDADLVDNPANAVARWPQPFEQRWLPSFAVGFAVQVIGAFGLLLLVVPGVIVFTLFGFAPLRILLRGEAPGDALRWCGQSMARHWPRIVQAALLILLLAFAGSLAMTLMQDAVFARFGASGPDPWTRLRHPLVWVSQALGSLALLWVSASFLSLYHRLERLAAGQPK